MPKPTNICNPAVDPAPPPPPGDNDCCQSGCTICVFDLYQDELDAYRLALAAWQVRQATLQTVS